ncbi:MAG: hypothetical protein HRF43_08810, partial [Phycisphaerae bacterium]
HPEEEGLRQIIEVLLNEPEHFAGVKDYLDPALIRDPGLAAVAGALVVMLGSGNEFRLVDLIARFESPAFGRLITDLAERGARRGKYAETLAGAIACLEACRSAREALALADEVRAGRGPGRDPSGASVPDGEDERLAALGERARGSSPEGARFAPPKLRRRVLG